MNAADLESMVREYGDACRHEGWCRRAREDAVQFEKVSLDPVAKREWLRMRKAHAADERRHRERAARLLERICPTADLVLALPVPANDDERSAAE